MGLFRNLINKIKKNEEVKVSFKSDLKNISINSNFLYPFYQEKINILEDKKIETINGRNVLFNSLNLKYNSIFEVLEITYKDIVLRYPKNIKVANFLYNYLILIGFPYFKNLKFDTEEDYKCYSNILALISKYELSDEINVLDFLSEVPWIGSLKIFGNENLEININGKYALIYDYEILEKSLKRIIGKSDNEYILVDLGTSEIKIGREL
ncbi:hypothetical protein H3N56_11525 [Cetobacterium sp. 2A]|uniref:hypothetical protein n=1 Tax=Cetobacterium sp. 2A TaxID=2754723 RepID=UPI00163C82C8|nr:hypothetical protein [Cetobacterium sp. 2A]MBC2857062.1 hypothetical protein [Cetobacterium sp. 2A]